MKKISLFLCMTLAVITSCHKDNDEANKSLQPNQTETTKATLTQFTILQPPTKTIYALDEKFDPTGIQVVGTYNDGQQRAITPLPEQFSGFSSEAPADQQKITLTIGEIKHDFNIRISPVRVKNGILTEIVKGHKEIILPQGIESIQKESFANSQIDKVVLNEGLKSIGEMAFFNSQVKEITFPSSLEKLDSDLFYYCSNLKKVDLSQTKITVLPASLFVFAGIEEITFPATLKEIQPQAFLCTSQLVKVQIPESVTTIGREAFRESGIKSIALPNSLTHLGERAFYHCPALSEVTTYGTLVRQDNDAAIQASCLVGCKQLSRLEIPQSIRILGQGLLTGNQKVTELTLPANISKMHFSTFDHTALKHVKVEAINPPEVTETVWYGFPQDLATLKVPATSVDAYKKANGWKEYADKISGF